MSTYAVTNKTVEAVHEAASSISNEAARAVLRAEMVDLLDHEIDDLLRMIQTSPFAAPKVKAKA